MSTEPDLIVLESPGSQFNGWWFDRNKLNHTVMGFARAPFLEDPDDADLRFQASGEFKVRDSDGAVGEIWRPIP